jgi:pimeloyl-ACP methyl ester carboxylesterase
MIHGAGGGGWEFREWKRLFESAGYRVVAPDLMPSKEGLAKTTLDDYVLQVARTAGTKPDVLIGASMGGVLVLKAAERLEPKAIVLVCSAPPAPVGVRMEPRNYPEIIEWKNGPYEDTVAAMPDSDEATRRWAHELWRNESGAVLRALSKGVETDKPKCPVLVVIPEADDTVPPETQQALAKWAAADTLRFHEMSHVGPLLSTRAPEVARSVLEWLRARRS